MTKIALMSVSDIQNYGDILFPFIARQEILKYIPDTVFRFFTPTEFEFENEHFFGYTKQALTEHRPDAVLVIGGEVIHKYDDTTWKKMYKTVQNPVLSDKVSDTFFDWIDLKNIYKAFFSVGVLLRYSDVNNLKLDDLKNLDYIGVRGLYSKKNLEKDLWTINSKIDIVPDIGWIFNRLCPNYNEIIKEISKKKNINLSENKYIIFNTNPTAINNEQISNVKNQLKEFANKNNIKIYLLSITKTYNEADILKQFESENCILLPDTLTLKEKLAVLCGSRFYIGSSLHSAITTLSMSKPAILIHKIALQKFQDLFNHSTFTEYLNDLSGWDNIENLLNLAENDFNNKQKRKVLRNYVKFMISSFDLKLSILCENIKKFKVEIRK